MTCPSDQDLAHLAECAVCRARAARYQDVAAAIPSAYATQSDPRFASEMLARIDAQRSRRRTPLELAVTFALIAAAFISLVTINVTGDRERELAPRGRTQPATAHFSERELGFQLFKNGARVLEHDRIRAGDGFTIRAFNLSGTDVELAIYAIDSAGEVHWLAPAWTSASEPPPKTRTLVASKTTIDLEEGVVPAAPALGKLVVYARFLEEPATTLELERSLAAATETSGVTETLELEVVP